jgi:hypothetical protein
MKICVGKAVLCACYGRGWNCIYWCIVERCDIMTVKNAAVKCVDCVTEWTICSLVTLVQGWQTFGTHAQNGKRKQSLGTLHSLLSLFYSFCCPTIVCILWTTSVYIHIFTAYRLYMNCRCYQMTDRETDTAVKHFYTIWSGVKCWLDICRWGAGLAVPGQIRDIGQNVLQSSFETGSSSSHSYCHSLLLIAFLEEAFVRNIVIIVWR